VVLNNGLGNDIAAKKELKKCIRHGRLFRRYPFVEYELGCRRDLRGRICGHQIAV
jgi:hypothetical protein